MSKKILTETRIREIVRKKLEEILSEDVNIDLNKNGRLWHRRTDIWINAANEIKKKGSTVINVPTRKGDIVKAILSKSSRGGIILKVGDIGREFGNMADAFIVLRNYIHNIN